MHLEPISTYSDRLVSQDLVKSISGALLAIDGHASEETKKEGHLNFRIGPIITIQLLHKTVRSFATISTMAIDLKCCEQRRSPANTCRGIQSNNLQVKVRYLSTVHLIILSASYSNDK